MQELKAKGMLKWDEKTNQWFTVEDIEEANQLKARFEEDAAAAQKMEQENKVLAQNAPHADRRRAGNFDQAINDFNGNKLFKSSLGDSVILVDHPAENDS